MLDFQNINCFDRMKQINDNSIPLIITDPPYGISFNGVTSNTKWDNMTDKEYYDFLVSFLSEVKRILTNDGTCWMCCARTKIPIVFKAIETVGLNNDLENWLTYIRGKSRSSKRKMKSQCEEVLHITKSKKYYWNSIEYLREVTTPYYDNGRPRGWAIDQLTGMRVRWSGIGNALFFSQPFFGSKFEKQIHSTQKPFLLWVELIMLSSKVGDTVFDPFSGSASSGVASLVCNRNYIGCELDTEMYNKAKNWLDHINYEDAKTYIHSRLKFSNEKDTYTVQSKIKEEKSIFD